MTLTQAIVIARRVLAEHGRHRAADRRHATARGAGQP